MQGAVSRIQKVEHFRLKFTSGIRMKTWKIINNLYFFSIFPPFMLFLQYPHNLHVILWGQSRKLFQEPLFLELPLAEVTLYPRDGQKLERTFWENRGEDELWRVWGQRESKRKAADRRALRSRAIDRVRLPLRVCVCIRVQVYVYVITAVSAHSIPSPSSPWRPVRVSQRVDGGGFGRALSPMRQLSGARSGGLRIMMTCV